jgi:selenocysteine lyase/cysteine desulfurase
MGVDLPMSENWPMTTLPPLIDDARRFELGLPTLPGLGAGRAGIELLQSVGVDAVHRRVEHLASRCIEELTERGVRVRTPLDPARRGGVIAIEHPQAPPLAAHLRESEVDIGGYDWGVARIDPHAFNDEADIQALLAGIESFPP